MSTREDYIEAVGQLVQGEIPLDEPDKILAIDLAVNEHSRYRPRMIVEDFDGDGGFDYAISGFSDWIEGFSVIKSVEYPVDDTDQTPDVLQSDEWMIYQKPAGKYLRFKENEPSADEDFRVVYTSLHAISDSACTVEDFDEQAVQALAAGFFCSMLATYYAQSADTSIDADSVAHANKSRDYEARSKAYRKIYFDHLGIKEGQVTPASITHDQDLKGSWATDKLTHKGKYR